MNPWKNTLWWRTYVCARVNVFATSKWWVCHDWSVYFFLILGLDTTWVCDCLFPSSIRLCLYIYLCLRSPSFTSSPLPPPLSIPYSIDFALWQTAVAFDPNPVICLYCVLNMVADEISMHYCHPVADSSTSACAAMRLLPAVSAVESLMLVDYFIFYRWIQGLFTGGNFGLQYIKSYVTLPQFNANAPLKWLLLACWASKHGICSALSRAFLFLKGFCLRLLILMLFWTCLTF